MVSDDIPDLLLFMREILLELGSLLLSSSHERVGSLRLLCKGTLQLAACVWHRLHSLTRTDTQLCSFKSCCFQILQMHPMRCKRQWHCCMAISKDTAGCRVVIRHTGRQQGCFAAGHCLSDVTLSQYCDISDHRDTKVSGFATQHTR